MAGRLSTYVHLREPEGLGTVGFGPDDEVPDWAARLITNPDAWEGGQAPSFDDVEDEDEDSPQVPPRGGPGSGAEAWRAYAAALGVEVASDASRDEVVAALEDQGKPVD